MLDFLEDIGEMIFGNKRLDVLRHFAASQGFKVRRRVNPELLPADVQGMEVFQSKGKRKIIKGLLYRRETSLDVLGQIFDYQSDFGGKSTTVYLYDSKALDLPYMILQPRSHLSKLNVFASSEWSSVDKDFAAAFSVESDDMNAMRMLITIQFADVMMDLKGYTVEGQGDYLAVYKKGHQEDIINMDNIYAASLDLVDIIIHDHSNELV